MFVKLIHKGKQIEKLRDIQKERDNIQKELSNYRLFPMCPYKIRKCPRSRNIDILNDLSDAIVQLWLGKIDFEKFNISLQRCYNINNASEYFEDLGNYFLYLSGNVEFTKHLVDKLAELDKKERELKEKLGIK